MCDWVISRLHCSYRVETDNLQLSLRWRQWRRRASSRKPLLHTQEKKKTKRRKKKSVCCPSSSSSIRRHWTYAQLSTREIFTTFGSALKKWNIIYIHVMNQFNTEPTLSTGHWIRFFPLHRDNPQPPPKKKVLVKTLNCVWRWNSSLKL